MAFQRPKSSDDAYADTLKSWVRRLLDAGVNPGRITLVGFSRGAQLTALASNDLAPAGINTALLAICEDGDVSQATGLVLGGNLLSEETWSFLSAAPAMDRTAKKLDSED
jgi:acetyl esterase/lipase